MPIAMHWLAVAVPNCVGSTICWSTIAAAVVLSGCQALIGPAPPLRVADAGNDPVEVVEMPV